MDHLSNRVVQLGVRTVFAPVPDVMTLTSDHRQGRFAQPDIYASTMKSSDVWAGVFGSVVCTVVGIPVALDPSLTAIPHLLWSTMFLVFLVLMTVCHWLSDGMPPRLVVGLFAGQVALGIALLLTAYPAAGWLPIMLVFTAALSIFLVARWATVVIIVAHTAAISCSAWLDGGSPADIAMSALIYSMLQFGTVLSVMALHHEAQMRRQLAVAHTELRAATALLAESSRADERLRISRELHDLIGHQLTALTLELEVASHRSQPPATEHVQRARAISRELLGDVRATVGQLRRTAPDLAESLHRIVADLPAPMVHLRVDEDIAIDEERATALVRCVQEIVTNTIRHAAAQRLWIEVSAGDPVWLRAWDDGTCAPEFTMGNGLRGMAERMEGLGGTARFEVDGGLRVEATVPA